MTHLTVREPGLHHLTRGGEEIEAHDVIQSDPILKPPETPGVFRHIAAQGGNRHAAGIGGIKQALGLNCLGQLGGDDPGLDHGVEIFFVDLQNPVEGVGEHHHAPGKGNSAAAQICPGAPHGHRQAMVVAQPHHLAQKLGGLGPDHQGRQDGLQHCGVIGIGKPIGFLEKDLFLAQEPLEFFYQAITDHTRLLPRV